MVLSRRPTQSAENIHPITAKHRWGKKIRPFETIGDKQVGGVLAGEEAGGSAEYRSDLGVLIGETRALGITTSWTVLPTGETYYGSFQSIDSELVLTGLRFGILPLLVLVVAVVTCVLGLLRGRATPAAVAVAAQVPAFATVALITQYGYLAWFLAGVAVTSYKLERADSISQPGSDSSITVDGARRERVRP